MIANQGKDSTIEPAYFADILKSTSSVEELPPVTVEDNGKVLSVVDGVWDKSESIKELPVTTSDDNGKVLTVNDSGEWSAAVPSTDESTLVIPAILNTSTYVVTFEQTLSDIKSQIQSALDTNKNVCILAKRNNGAYTAFYYISSDASYNHTFMYIARGLNSTVYWTIEISSSLSKTTTFSAKTVNDPV